MRSVRVRGAKMRSRHRDAIALEIDALLADWPEDHVPLARPTLVSPIAHRHLLFYYAD